MREKVVKKIKKYAKRDGIEYVRHLKQWPFMARLRFAWFILFRKVK